MSFDFSTDKCRRGSFTTALAVDIGCEIGDVKEAAKYMASCGVPIGVTKRVLLTPHLRRKMK